MRVDVSPLLMFTGRAEEAMNFYLKQFPESRIDNIIRYGEDEAGLKGSVKMAAFRVGAQRFLCTDSVLEQAYGFTPVISLYTRCTSESEIRRLTAALSEHGSVCMPLGDYGFGQLFAWVNDAFGVSWQLHWA